MAAMISFADASVGTAPPTNASSIATIRAGLRDRITVVAFLTCIVHASGTPRAGVQLDSTDSTDST
ncbi:MAG: hypothetical protein WCQ91_08825, partial [Planctomycetota bacterium]